MKQISGDWPRVQLALDLTHLENALRVAAQADSAGIQWIEAGTPLIKSEGMKAVRSLRKAFRSSTIIADMKTLDAGLIETKIAFEAGADVVSISALSHNRTIMDSVSVAETYEGLIMSDLLMCADPLRRARKLESLGVHIVCFHTGVDAQQAERAHPKVVQVKKLASNLRIPVAVAGGVNPSRAVQLVRAGAKIMIVGGWITSSKNPYRASKMILNILYDSRPVKTASTHQVRKKWHQVPSSYST